MPLQPAPGESVVMKMTIFSQVRRNKDSEYLFKGDLPLSQVIGYLDQACIEAEHFKDPTQPAFLLIDDTIYCHLENVAKIRAIFQSD